MNSISKASNFHLLCNDEINQILTFVEMKTVCLFGRTNKELHALTNSNEVWEYRAKCLKLVDQLSTQNWKKIVQNHFESGAIFSGKIYSQYDIPVASKVKKLLVIGNNLIYTCQNSPSINVFDLKTKKLLYVIKDLCEIENNYPNDEIYVMPVIEKYKDELFVGLRDGMIKKIDLSTGKTKGLFEGLKNEFPRKIKNKICQLKVHDDKLIATSFDKYMYIWDIPTSKLKQRFSIQLFTCPYKVCFDVKDDLIGCSFKDIGTIQVFDVKKAERIFDKTFEGGFMDFLLLNDQKLFINLGETAEVWCLQTQKKIESAVIPEDSPPVCVQTLPIHRKIVVKNEKLLDNLSLKLERLVLDFESNSLTYSKKIRGDRLVVTENYRITIWNILTKKKENVFSEVGKNYFDIFGYETPSELSNSKIIIGGIENIIIKDFNPEQYFEEESSLVKEEESSLVKPEEPKKIINNRKSGNYCLLM